MAARRAVQLWLFVGQHRDQSGRPARRLVPVRRRLRCRNLARARLGLRSAGCWQWKKGFAFIVLAVLLASLGLDRIEWTQPVGKPLGVSLVQGGIPQSERWDMRLFDRTLTRYYHLVARTRGELVLLPEAAIPVALADMPPEYLRMLREVLKR